MIDKLDIKDSLSYKDRVDLLCSKLNEIINSINYIEDKVASNIADIKSSTSDIRKDQKKLESSVEILTTHASNKSMDNKLFVKSVLDRIDILKNKINKGLSDAVSIQLKIVENIEEQIKMTTTVTKEQLKELNEIYSNVENRIWGYNE